MDSQGETGTLKNICFCTEYLTITGIDDYDPEKYGTDTRGHAYPNAKTFSVGLNITL